MSKPGRIIIGTTAHLCQAWYSYLAQGERKMESENSSHCEEEQVREIWRQLEIGKSGAISLQELKSLCGHIGMQGLTNEEWQHLFSKLDADEDNNISFHEFLGCLLEHGRSHTPNTRGHSTPRKKLRFSITVEDRVHHMLFATTDSGWFSQLDPRGTGFATAEDIIDEWESLGVPQGADILDYLQFDLTKKVNLNDLSSALEQEVTSIEVDNATYQAAIASFLSELKFIKGLNEQMESEKSKLEADLTQANSRIDCLIKETDEMTNLMESSTDTEIQDLRKKYEDQIKTLLADAEELRLSVMKEHKDQVQVLQKHILELEENEAILKNKLSCAQKEIARLEGEIEYIGEHCTHLEEKTLRLQSELDNFSGFNKMLDEMNSSKKLVEEEHQKYQEEKLEHLKFENLNLKDKTDELTMELEELKQRLSGSRRRSMTYHSTFESFSLGNRHGSILADYLKPILTNNISQDEALPEETENKEENNAASLDAQLKSLTQKLKEEKEKRLDIEETLQHEIMDLHLGHKAQVHQLKEEFEKMKSQAEQMHNIYVMELKQKFQKEKEDFLILAAKQEGTGKDKEEEFQQRLALEVKKCRSEMQLDTERKLQEQEKEILSKVEAEKSHLKQMHQIEKESIHYHYTKSNYSFIPNILPAI